LVERPVAGDAQAAFLVGGGNEPKEQLGAGVVQGGKAEFVDDDEVSPQQLRDDSSHGVVGQAPVEGFEQPRRDEVSDPKAGGHGGMPHAQEEVALASARRADQAEVLGGPNPLQACQVVEGGLRDGGEGQVELLQGFLDGEARDLQSRAPVGVLSGGDLGLDQGPKQLLGSPPLGLGR